MNRRTLLLTTARTAIVAAFGTITGARAQTPISGRTVLPIPQARVTSPPALDARDARAPTIQPLRPPEGAPNIVIVLIDDMGFGASSAYGGPCNMPVAERLAQEGLTYTRFHTTALCSPTRQAMLTGRNHHSVNMAAITEIATGFPGYTSVRPDSAATIAQILRFNGYNTAVFGKMHQTQCGKRAPPDHSIGGRPATASNGSTGLLAAKPTSGNPTPLPDGCSAATQVMGTEIPRMRCLASICRWGKLT